MPKIAMIGAGSVEFAQRLTADVLACPELQNSCIVYMDINAEKLDLTRALAERMIAQNHLPAQVRATLNRREAIEGADYVVIMIQVGGMAAIRPDIEIPLRYGVDQTASDTIGPGGVFRALRTIPVVVDICKDVEELSPRALVVNYSNPMAMLCWAINLATKVRAVGFCHSIQGNWRQLARYMEIPADELVYWAAGINHQAWFLRLEWQGRDAYPILHQRIEDPEFFAKDRVRFEMLRHFGYFVSESTRHNSEYVPWFRKRPELVEEFAPPSARTRHYENWELRRAKYFADLRETLVGDAAITLTRSSEYFSRVLVSELTNVPCRVNGNVRNTGLIPNLPDGCCVEVPCFVDNAGVHPAHVGALPAQLAAINRTNINVQELAVKAALESDRSAAYQALQLDPLTAAVCSLAEVRQMTDELFEASAPWLRM